MTERLDPHTSEVPPAPDGLREVTLMLCDLCLDGKGGECHTPGCSLWLNRAPDRPFRDHPCVLTIDGKPAPAYAAEAASRPPTPNQQLAIAFCAGYEFATEEVVHERVQCCSIYWPDDAKVEAAAQRYALDAIADEVPHG